MITRLRWAVVAALFAAPAFAGDVQEIPAANDDSFSAAAGRVWDRAASGASALKADAGLNSHPLAASPADALTREIKFTIERRGEFYLLFGNGEALPGGGLQNHVFEAGVKESVAGPFSVGIALHNDGHPRNDIGDTRVNHRDGIAVLGWYDAPLGDKAVLEAGVGPYFAMNTVARGSTELDEKQLGGLAVLALVFPVGKSGSGVRIQYDYAMMPGFNTRTWMLGYNQQLQTTAPSSAGSQQERGYGLYGGAVITNRGTNPTRGGFQLEHDVAVDRAIRYSVSIISEGRDHVLSDRAGVAAQAWYEAPPAGRWTISVGAGPYVAYEADPNSKGVKVLALVSLQAERPLSERWSGVIRFSRVVSDYNTDADMIFFGVKRDLRQ